MRIVQLASGEAAVGIAPELGGAIVSFAWRGCPVLRPTADSALADADVRRTACYPLVPYSNRIRDARLTFGGRDYTLERNFGTHPHAIHGVGWQRAWSIAEAERTHARLTLAHDPRNSGAGAWPWPFRATQTFALSLRESGAAPPAALLTATLTLENPGAAAFPFGLGWHPFFPLDASTRLCFSAQAVWNNDATQLPLQRVAVPAAWRFDAPRAPDSSLDNVFTGWNGTATLETPSLGMRMTLAADRACRYLVVYAPAGAGFIALEPVTHETDAFNRSARGDVDTGLRTLPPGGVFSCTMRVAAASID